MTAERYPQARRAPWPERREEPAERIDPTTGEIVPATTFKPLDVTDWTAEELDDRRAALPPMVQSAGWDLTKTVDRIQRLADDDRFAGHQKEMAPHLRSHLTHAIEVCQDLLDRINKFQLGAPARGPESPSTWAKIPEPK